MTNHSDNDSTLLPLPSKYLLTAPTALPCCGLGRRSLAFGALLHPGRGGAADCPCLTHGARRGAEILPPLANAKPLSAYFMPYSPVSDINPPTSYIALQVGMHTITIWRLCSHLYYQKSLWCHYSDRH